MPDVVQPGNYSDIPRIMAMDIQAGLVEPTISIGGGTTLTGVVVYASSLTPAALAASTGPQEQTFTVTGLATNDKVIVNPPAAAANTAFLSARVSAANTLAITFFNNTAAANVPAAGIYNIVAIRS